MSGPKADTRQSCQRGGCGRCAPGSGRVPSTGHSSPLRMERGLRAAPVINTRLFLWTERGGASWKDGRVLRPAEERQGRKSKDTREGRSPPPRGLSGEPGARAVPTGGRPDLRGSSAAAGPLLLSVVPEATRWGSSSARGTWPAPSPGGSRCPRGAWAGGKQPFCA